MINKRDSSFRKINSHSGSRFIFIPVKYFVHSRPVKDNIAAANITILIYQCHTRRNTSNEILVGSQIYLRVKHRLADRSYLVRNFHIFPNLYHQFEMCILFINRNPKADKTSYRLIVASNRDEVYGRPTKPAHFWENNPECLGGTDDEPGREGGTWLAVSTSGRAGSILNLTGERRPLGDHGKGRGNLVVDYVTSEQSAENYLSQLHKINQNSQSYSPYNLILLDMRDASVYYLTSSSDSTGPQKCLDDILGIGNSPLEQPFAKVRGGKEKFKEIVNGSTVSDRDRLIVDLGQFLKSTESYLPDEELRRRSPNWCEALSSIFVRDDNIEYGTRTHTILLVDGANNVTFVEETRMPDGIWKTQLFETILK